MGVLSFISEILFPPRCVFCRSALESSKTSVCRECAGSLPLASVGQMRGSYPHVASCVYPLVYRGVVRKSLHRFKFGNKPFYASAYARLAVSAFNSCEIIPAPDVVTWVPVSKNRIRKRGYDQAEIFAREVARETGLPCEKLLIKTLDNKPQSGMSRSARAANVLGVYESQNGVSDKVILLADDIVTTGATISECARVLLTSGAAKVYGIAVAKTEMPK